jgi:hypothetical protein
MMIQSMARHLMEARMTREDLEEILCMVKMMTINMEKTKMAKAVTILAKDLLEEEMEMMKGSMAKIVTMLAKDHMEEETEMMRESMGKTVKDQVMENQVMKAPAVMMTTKEDQELEVHHMAVTLELKAPMEKMAKNLLSLVAVEVTMEMTAKMEANLETQMTERIHSDEVAQRMKETSMESHIKGETVSLV